MKYSLGFLALGLAISVPTTCAHATSIVGSDSISFNSVSVTPPGALYPIGSVNSINFGAPGNTSSTGLGNFALIPTLTAVTFNGSLFPAGLDGGTGGLAFSFTIVGFGTFTETANPVVNTNGTPSPGVSNVDIYLLGNFVPSGALASFTPGPASFDVSFTENGSFSGSGTLASPPTPLTGVTPEPSSLVLLGTGLAGAAGTMFRRRRVRA